MGTPGFRVGRQPSNDSKRLRIPLEPFTVSGVNLLADDLLAIVTERWVSKVMSEASCLDHVGD